MFQFLSFFPKNKKISQGDFLDVYHGIIICMLSFVLGCVIYVIEQTDKNIDCNVKDTNFIQNQKSLDSYCLIHIYNQYRNVTFNVTFCNETLPYAGHNPEKCDYDKPPPDFG